MKRNPRVGTVSSHVLFDPSIKISGRCIVCEGVAWLGEKVNVVELLFV